jgi:DAACS family dicarboxylate/amino acid:cation (Na+ or H+) symporter
MDLTKRIILSMLLGVLLGVIVNVFASNLVVTLLLVQIADLIGKVFLACLQMVVIPLVLFSILSAIINIDGGNAIGKISLKAITAYLCTTLVAITIGLCFATLFSPGQNASFMLPTEELGSTDVPDLVSVVSGFFSTNPFASLAQGNIIQVIILAIIVGFSLRSLGDRVSQLKVFIAQANILIFDIIDRVIRVSPWGVFALIFETFATEGFAVFVPLMGYVAVVIIALLFHGFLTYGLMLSTFSISPWYYFKNMRTPLIFAFSTASSAATIPVTIKALDKNCGVDPSVSSFVIPIGATINMDGTAIMQGVATVFISNLYGIDLGMMDFLMIIITATLASIGTASVPSAGLIMLTMVLNQVGLPIEGIALIIGIDRLLDMIRTSINIAGDGVIACIIAKTEGLLDISQFKMRVNY